MVCQLCKEGLGYISQSIPMCPLSQCPARERSLNPPSKNSSPYLLQQRSLHQRHTRSNAAIMNGKVAQKLLLITLIADSYPDIACILNFLSPRFICHCCKVICNASSGQIRRQKQQRGFKSTCFAETMIALLQSIPTTSSISLLTRSGSAPREKCHNSISW